MASVLCKRPPTGMGETIVCLDDYGRVWSRGVVTRIENGKFCVTVKCLPTDGLAMSILEYTTAHPGHWWIWSGNMRTLKEVP